MVMPQRVTTFLGGCALSWLVLLPVYFCTAVWGPGLRWIHPVVMRGCNKEQHGALYGWYLQAATVMHCHPLLSAHLAQWLVRAGGVQELEDASRLLERGR